ncbi:aspartate kinase [Thermoplasma sp.]|uniref:aspartate kinase n=1 Tax=Thermoplasma sp. TaxID=1973142 RepID=UPI001277B5F9|nr:aspartate kinase [Thermoplasma sp.]KAA8921953.1 MAG: aspartate kinase [Thermoplasma sp.]
MDRKFRGNVEEKTLEYLRKRPEVYMALGTGIVNLNGLAALISRENQGMNQLSIRSVLQKIIRSGEISDYRRFTDDLLRRSKVTLQDKVSVITSRRKMDIDFLSVTFLTDSVVYIVDETRVRNIPKDAIIERNVSLIHIFSPPEIVSTPGFALNVVQRIYAANVNILQFISCSNETMIVVNRDDAIKAYSALASY